MAAASSVIAWSALAVFDRYVNVMVLASPIFLGLVPTRPYRPMNVAWALGALPVAPSRFVPPGATLRADDCAATIFDAVVARRTLAPGGARVQHLGGLVAAEGVIGKGECGAI